MSFPIPHLSAPVPPSGGNLDRGRPVLVDGAAMMQPAGQFVTAGSLDVQILPAPSGTVYSGDAVLGGTSLGAVSSDAPTFHQHGVAIVNCDRATIAQGAGAGQVSTVVRSGDELRLGAEIVSSEARLALDAGRTLPARSDEVLAVFSGQPIKNESHASIFGPAENTGWRP